MKPISIPSLKGQLPNYTIIGGWLWLLILTLTILSPLTGILNLLKEGLDLIENWNALSAFPILLGYLLLVDIISLILIGYSIYVGIGLWKKKRKAVNNTKVFLIINMAARLFITIVIIFIPFEREYKASIIGAAIAAIIVNSLWYLYLNKSERIRMTYNL